VHLVVLEGGKCFTLQFEELNLCLVGVVIHEADVVGTSTEARGLQRPPQVSVNKFAICECTILRFIWERLTSCFCLSASIAELGVETQS
jgi:hypothetical protein